MGVNHDIRSSYWFVRVFVVIDQDDNLITKLVMNLYFDAIDWTAVTARGWRVLSIGQAPVDLLTFTRLSRSTAGEKSGTG